MTKSELFRQAHKNTREVIKSNKEISYRVQFGLELSNLQRNLQRKEIKKSKLHYNSKFEEYMNLKERMEISIHNAKLDNKKVTVKILEKNLKILEERIEKIS